MYVKPGPFDVHPALLADVAERPSLAYLLKMAKAKGQHGGAREGGGGQFTPVHTHKRHRVVLLLDDAEWRLLDKAAGKRRPSEFAREVVFRHLARGGK